MKPLITYKVYDTFFRFNNHLMERNKSLINKYKNNRCFVLLTGESLSHLDLSLLSNEYTLGTNFIFLHPEIDKLKIDFFLCTEAGKHMDKVNRHRFTTWPENYIKSNGINQGTIFFREAFKKLYNSKTKIFLNHNKINHYKNIKVFDINDENLFYLKLIPDFNGKKSPKTDLTKRFSVFPGAGSQSIAIMLLINMGFKEIYLCGAGYTYSPSFMLHFYDNYIFPKNIGKEKAVKKIKDTIHNWNLKVNGKLEYYGVLETNDSFRGICVRKEMRNHIEQLETDRIINNYAISKGVKIINIVPENFESPIYEKISWEEVVTKIK